MHATDSLPFRRYDWSAIMRAFDAVNPTPRHEWGEGAPRHRWNDEPGFWAVYSISLACGGSEEGGWYYEVGALEGCIRTTRRVVYTPKGTVYCDAVDAEGNPCAPMLDRPAFRLAVAIGRAAGRYGWNGRASDVGGGELRLVWCKGEQLPDAYFPTSRPSYE